MWQQRSFLNQKEKNIQKSVVDYLRYNRFYTIDCDPMFALSYIAGDNNKRIVFCKEKKTKGWTKGQPDLIAISPKGDILFIEMKQSKGRLSEEQKYFQEFCEKVNIKHYVWYSLDDCIKSIGELNERLD